MHRRGVLTFTAVVALVGCGGGPQSTGNATTDTQAEIRDPGAGSDNARSFVRSRLYSVNRSGISLTLNASGGPLDDPSNPFFQSLGTNGRSCHTCHEPETGMTLTPERARLRFVESRGTEPLFRPNDGAVNPNADVSTVRAREQAYALLLDRGLIRVGIGMPQTGAEFELVQVEDPYGYASAKELSLFRRPPASANLRFLSTVMWDGRETFKDSTLPTGFASIHFDLADQSNAATTGHAQGQPLSQAQRESIVAFEMQLFTAQQMDFRAGLLTSGGARGGPEALIDQEYYFGINDPLGADPEGFHPVSMTSFDGWVDADGDGEGGGHRGQEAARAAIVRGQALFNSHPISITGVSGLNDDLNVASIPGTCTTCHDAPNAGNHSVPAPLRIGTAEVNPVGGLDVSGLPIYTLRKLATGETVRVTDPGRALITGKWKDIARFKGPTLRGLASRAPYFHNGSARTIADVVNFYDQRFALQLTDQQKSDLGAFLAAL
jgi:cytochrome c peroxidase